ncbi:MAG TPA: hypothetical protein VHW71_13730 [Steroidobacteraceae bacterium]|jgi:hypothetical protein|nr:hypothetical protein [Steroidobacteraceae bacterium]
MNEVRFINFARLRVHSAGTLLCALCLAYFYLLDRVFFSSAHFSPIFRLLLTIDLRTAWISLAICLVAALWNRPAPITRLVDVFGRHPYLIALASTALIAIGAITVYHDYPLSMDEYAAVFQAKIFASGHVYAQLPPKLVDWFVVRGFNGSFLNASPETGRAIEYYWPGFALLLAPFEFLKIPWLCNASLAGLSIFLVHWITGEITGDRRAAGWAVLFTVASGAFLADALSYYSMQAHLTANLVYVALLLKPNKCRVTIAGLVGSLALNLHNPVPHALFATPWIVAMAMDRERRSFLLPLMLGYLPGIGIGLLWIIYRLSIASEPYGVSAFSAIADGIFMWPNSPLLNMRAAALAKMWVWAVPCLFVFALLGRIWHGDNRHVRTLTHSAVLTFAGYLFVRFDQGHGWGYRYFHSAWAVIPILAGSAMTCRSRAQRRLISFAGAAAILNLLIVIPFQMHEISNFISQHLAQLPSPKRPGSNVYFIHPRGGFYVADMVQIDPLLRNRDLFLVSHGADFDTQLVRQNWPGAVRIASGRSADQWYLGPDDRRFPFEDIASRKDFLFTPDSIPQSEIEPKR